MFVSITEVPDAPKQPTVKEVYHDSALISWEPPADGGKPITGYIVERKETKANRYTPHSSEKRLDICSLTDGFEMWKTAKQKSRKFCSQKNHRQID